jgi:hypothetical protein
VTEKNCQIESIIEDLMKASGKSAELVCLIISSGDWRGDFPFAVSEYDTARDSSTLLSVEVVM